MHPLRVLYTPDELVADADGVVATVVDPEVVFEVCSVGDRRI